MDFFRFRQRRGRSDSEPEQPVPSPQPEGSRQEPEKLQLPSGPLVMQLPPGPLVMELPPGPYTSSDEYLWDELQRIDQLIRAQTVRWQLSMAAHKPQDLWGMINVSQSEVNAYLTSNFIPPFKLPDEIERELEVYWRRAFDLATYIQTRLDRTPPQVQASLRLKRIEQLFDITPLQRDMLLLCLMPELDGRYRRLFGYLQDDAQRTLPTAELTLQILQPVVPDPGVGRAALDARSPLLTNRLLLVLDKGQAGVPFSMRPVRVDDRIVSYLLGSDVPDGRLAHDLFHLVKPLDSDRVYKDPERIKLLQSLVNWRKKRNQASLFYLHGPYGSGRLTAARTICEAGRTPLFIVNVNVALGSDTDWEQIVDLCYREARLYGAATYWAKCELLTNQSQSPRHWEYLLAAATRYPGFTFLSSQAAWVQEEQPYNSSLINVEFSVPNYDLRRRLWDFYMPAPQEFADPDPGRVLLAESLANTFQLTEGQIVDAIALARAEAAKRDPKAPQITVGDLTEACRKQTSRYLSALARRIETRTDLTFSDLILPPASERQLQELRKRVRYLRKVDTGMGFERRIALGKGLIALFTGSSGTGKTMATELLAREHGAALYKADLSAVVSKYIGETEKNLAEIFKEAEHANAIIFFDEADAIFGKRGEVKDARDRYANLEINYLLQRVEEYSGVVILASNLSQNIDEAFMRRIHMVVEFTFPEADARFRIWRGMFPPGIGRPVDRHLEALAQRFRLSGGSIKNVVLDAAFRALVVDDIEGIPEITPRHLIASIAREYQKLGKPITKGEFGEEYYDWVDRDILQPGRQPSR